VSRPPAARAAPAERPCALPPKAVPPISRPGKWPEPTLVHIQQRGLSGKVMMLNEEDPVHTAAAGRTTLLAGEATAPGLELAAR